MKKVVTKYVGLNFKNRPRYQKILINLPTASNITLKLCEFLPLSKIYDSAPVVCKQVIVLLVQLFGAH